MEDVDLVNFLSTGPSDGPRQSMLLYWSEKRFPSFFGKRFGVANAINVEIWVKNDGGCRNWSCKGASAGFIHAGNRFGHAFEPIHCMYLANSTAMRSTMKLST